METSALRLVRRSGCSLLPSSSGFFLKRSRSRIDKTSDPGTATVLHHAQRFILLIALTAIAPGVGAVKLYKWVDEDGTVHYQDRPPPKGTARVEEKELDPNANVIPGETEATAAGAQEEAGGGPGAADGGGRRTKDDMTGVAAAQQEATDTGQAKPPLESGADTAEGAGTADAAGAAPTGEAAEGADTATGGATAGDLVPTPLSGSAAGTAGAAGTAPGGVVAPPAPVFPGP